MMSSMRRPRPWLVLPLIASLYAVGSPGLILAARGQDVPFKGIVVQKNVKVLAGAGRKYYQVGTVKKGQLVEVEQVVFGWNEIVPPKGVYSYISQAFVDAQGKGKIGVVNADDAKVSAGNLQGPGLSYSEQTTLDKGAKVQILGEDGSFYKIAPPKGAYVYLPPGSIRRAAVEQEPKAPAQGIGSQKAAAQQPSPTKTSHQPVAPEQGPKPASHRAATHKHSASVLKAPSTAPSPKQLSKNTPAAPKSSKISSGQTTTHAPAKNVANRAAAPKAAPAVKVKTPATSAALRKVEMRELPLFSEPISKQPLAKMKAAYLAVAQDASLPAFDRQIIRVRLAMIKRNKAIAATLADVQKVEQQVDRSEKAQQAAAAKAKKKLTPADYDLVGQLESSSVYDGSSMPLLYRIVDHHGNTLAYVKPDKVNAKKMLGQIVGVMGRRVYNSALNLDIFQVKRIDILAARQTR